MKKTKLEEDIQQRELHFLTLKVIDLNEAEFIKKLGIKGKEYYVDLILDKIIVLNKKIREYNEDEK